MPAPILDRLAERAIPGRGRAIAEFLRFGVVGTLGFLVDTAALYAALGLGLGLYSGRAVSYVVAASTTWALNRAWTFRGRGDGRPAWRQWALFLAVNLVGFACNYGTYAALVAGVPLVAETPVIGVAAGAVAGLAGNFLLSRRYVFAARTGRRTDP
jgi:putative flippase GtrA